VIIDEPEIFGNKTNLIMALFALVLFALSLIVQNRKFKERSLNFKNTYIDLQQLFVDCNETNVADMSNKYNKILKESENHSAVDYYYFLVFGKSDSRRPSCWNIIFVYSYISYRIIVLGLLYLMPLGLGMFYASIQGI